MAKGKSTWKYNKLLTARRNYFANAGPIDIKLANVGDASIIKHDMPSSTGIGSNTGQAGLFGAIGSIGIQAASDITGMINNINANDVKEKSAQLATGINSAQVDPQSSADTFDDLVADIGNTAQLQHITARQLGAKNFGQGFGEAFAAGNAGFAAGSGLGPIGAAASAIGSTVTSIIGNVFRNRRAEKEAKKLNALIDYTNNFNERSMVNRAENLTENQMSDLLANYAALGGQLFSSGGSIHIKPENRGKFTDYCGGNVTAECIARGKRSSSPAVRKRATFAANARKWKHAFGGDLLTHGSNFDTGVTLIGNGGTHEENPYEGVLMGVDSEGVPNLVEEGEVIFNDYVFSNRLKVPKEVRKKYKLRGTKPLTFAEAATQMSKESEERPNDPISQNGLQALMSNLAYDQEELKAKNQKGLFAYGGKVNKFDGETTVSNYMRNPNSDAPYNREDVWAELMGRQLVNRLTKLLAMSEGEEKEKAIASFIDEANSLQDSYYKDIYNSGVEWGGKALKGKGETHQKAWQAAGYNNYQPDTYDYWYKPSNRSTDVRDTWVDNIIGDVTLNRNLGDSRFIRSDNLEKITNLARNLGLDWKERGDGNTLMYFSRSTNPAQATVSSDPANISQDDVVKILTSAPGDVKIEDKTVSTKPDDDEKTKPRPTWLRYAPAIGAGIGFLTDSFGLTNKPDYSNADAILEATKDGGTYQPVRFNPIGNYLTYTPFDRDYYINKLNAEAGATRRAILNTSGGNRATAMATLLASDYNAQGQLGQLARQAEEYNLGQRQKVEEFNRSTNMANSQGFLQADIANQKALAESREFALKGTLAAAQMREAIRQQTDANKSSNLSNFLQSIGDIGWENEQKNWRNAMYLAGAFGGRANPESERLMGLTSREKPKSGKKKGGLTI